MKIYISHSSALDYEMELYAPLMASDLWGVHQFIFPHVTSPYNPAKSKADIESCDLMIAEISYASTGSGIEMGWANAAGVRIAALHKKNAKITTAIRTVTNETIPYDDFVEAVQKLLG